MYIQPSEESSTDADNTETKSYELQYTFLRSDENCHKSPDKCRFEEVWKCNKISFSHIAVILLFGKNIEFLFSWVTRIIIEPAPFVNIARAHEFRSGAYYSLYKSFSIHFIYLYTKHNKIKSYI